MARRGHSKSIIKHIALTRAAERRWGPKRRWRCLYCGRGAGIVVDHFWPSVLHGSDEVQNLVPACDRCNTSKAGMNPFLWMIAVGVPFHRRSRIGEVTNNPSWRAPIFPDVPRIELDYSAMRAIPALTGHF